MAATPRTLSAGALRRSSQRVRIGLDWTHFSLARRFLLISLLVLVAGATVMGVWIGRLVETGVLNRIANTAGLYVDSVITDDLQTLATRPQLTPQAIADLNRILSETPLGKSIVAFKVWSPTGEVLYSLNPALIGRRFPLDSDLQLSLTGKVTADISNLSDDENIAERQRWKRLLQVYVPAREDQQGKVIAAVEFYQLPDELDREVFSAKVRAWAVVAGITAAMYLLLAGVVKRGSDTIVRQDAALTRQVAELSSLLAQNSRLHERVRQAAGRTTTLNEQALRRIGADLHDGPGQALGLALLRLDAAHSAEANEAQQADFEIVRGAMQDALTEMRAITSGLRAPVLRSLTPQEVVKRAVSSHERRTGTPIRCTTEGLPASAPLAVKIVLFRSLQESLSNATRHGGGADVTVHVWSSADALHLTVSDHGPGFDTAADPGEEHLGLAGMRERAELLGGDFVLDSAPGQGATVRIRLPLAEVSE